MDHLFFIIQLICQRFTQMTSSKKNMNFPGQYKSHLPDFLLTFIDGIIKFDTYGALRSHYMHYKIDELINEQVQTDSVMFIYIDPSGKNQVIVLTQKFHQISKSSESIPRKQKQLIKLTRQNYNDLKYQQKNCLVSILAQHQLQSASKLQLISIDQIRVKCQANIYKHPQDVIKDIRNVLAWNQIYRCASKRSFAHLSNLYQKIIDHIVKKKFIRTFFSKKHKDFQQLQKFELQFKVNTTKWPIIPTSFRQYENIQDFVPSPSNRKQIIEQKLKSQKVPIQCQENCICMKTDLQQKQEFCVFSLAHGWKSSCPNRMNKIQCNHKDQEKMKKCRNSQIKKKWRKKCKKSQIELGNDYQIEQFMAWGLDLYTRNFIYYSLPEIQIDFDTKIINVELKNNFIQKTLQKAFNFMGQIGYNIEQACKFIIQNSSQSEVKVQKQNKKFTWTPKKQLKIIEEQGLLTSILPKKISSKTSIKQKKQYLFTQKDREYAQFLLQNKSFYDKSFPDNQNFRIHTKGKGARCINKNGIKQGRFIVEYFGQIYQPWRWYQREDFIKQVLKKKKQKNVIPQFYNIYLEKHKDQPLGYDILVVDPIRKGNFSSRFSHSCNPNCGTITTVSNGKYYIGMYSFRDIQYGQQLTFDYCSMTESSFQHTNSICLCGMKMCRGNYLQLSNSRIYNNLMDSNSCFHFRNSLMLRSLGPITQKQLKICEHSNIKKGMIQNTPTWIIKWASQILELIQKQAETYKQNLIEQWKKNYPWKIQNQNQQQQTQNIQLYSQTSKQDLISLRFQNLITSIDKLKYYLSSIEDEQAPIYPQKISRVYSILVSAKDSVLKELQDVLIRQKFKKQAILVQKFIEKIQNSQVGQTEDEKLQHKIFLFRLSSLCISQALLTMPQVPNMNTNLLSDIMYFYAFTHTYFAPHQYKAHSSQQIKVTLQQILGDSYASKTQQKTRKKYTSPAVWGQIVSWFKQTIVNPEASLSQDRRGTLSFPLIRSILRSEYPFQRHNRKSFLKSIRQRPASCWPPATGCELSYKNPYKCYGTLLFENVHNAQKLIQLPKGSLLQSCLDLINNSLKQKLILFKQVQMLLNKTPQNSQKYNFLQSFDLDFDKTPPAQILQTKQKGRKKANKNKMQEQEQKQQNDLNQ